jgi:SAM-dependent methyltransferase
MLKESKREKQIESVRGWWNLSRSDNKWDKDYEDFPDHGSRYLISRKNIVLKYLDELQLDKGSNILELGYGAGQVALEIGKRGFNTYGLDISEKFSISATARCINGYPDGFFDLRVGSIESKYDFDDGYFDAVIVVGALQYLFSPNDCFKEVFRVLKPNGHFIIAQRNIYSLSNFTSVRYFLRSLLKFLLREKFELFPSFKSMFTESKLGYFFGKYKNSGFFNSKFMLKGHDVWKFEINKRANSYFSLKSRLKKNGFKFLNADGAYFAFSEDPKYYDFNRKFDKALIKIADKLTIPFIFTLGRSVVLKAKKTS